MKSLKRRIGIHFSLQFTALLIFLIFFIVGLLLLLIQFFVQSEINSHPHYGVVESLSSEVEIKNGEVSIKEHWLDYLKEKNLWLQIVSEEGEVFFSYNTPSDIQEAYQIVDLMMMEETKQFHDYEVYTFYDAWYSDPAYFILGSWNPLKIQLEGWYHVYQQDQAALHAIEEEVLSLDGTLYIFHDNQLQRTLGKKRDVIQPLEVIGMIKEPGKYDSKLNLYVDQAERTRWILLTPNDHLFSFNLFIYKDETIFILVICLIVLLVAIFISIWFAYRYGQPLMLFINWLERMGKGKYSEMLTPREQKRLFRKNGKIRRRYGLYKEVFESFQAVTEKLASTEKERLRLEQTREEWMAGISHDLRTPLATIQGYGHLLESEQYEYTKEEIIEIGRVIREKGDYMVSLVDDFSLVFRLKNTVIALEKTEVELNKLLEDVVHQFQEDLTMMRTHFIFSGMEEKLYFQVDRKLFVRVLDNLIYNAVKHNPEGTTVRVELEEQEKDILIKISDNGIGMDEETVTSLFDQYYRGTNTSERTDGAGLGMSIAKAIVELHGGTITVHSKIGAGTTILVELPR